MVHLVVEARCVLHVVCRQLASSRNSKWERGSVKVRSRWRAVSVRPVSVRMPRCSPEATALVSGCWPLAVAASIHDCSWLASCVSAELGSLGKMSEHSISENSSLRILEVLGGSWAVPPRSCTKYLMVSCAPLCRADLAQNAAGQQAAWSCVAVMSALSHDGFRHCSTL